MQNRLVILGLGSNVGKRREMIERAISRISISEELALTDISISQFYESQALLPENAPTEWDIPFINAVMSGYSNLPAYDILKIVKNIEHNMGRKYRGHWGPREIDIDILAIGNEIINEDKLTIPHKELLKRDFVIKPLAEIHPNWTHPITGRKIKELLP